MGNKLSPSEEAVMEATFKATMLRAADILDRINADDVADAQLVMHRNGLSLEQLAKIDRAMIGTAHLRACALRGKDAQATNEDLMAHFKGGK